MSSEQTELKLFVGVKDSDKLSLMATIARELGFIVANNSLDLRFHTLDFNGREVVIQGGVVTQCIPELIKLALDSGAARVTVDLEQCRDYDVNESRTYPLLPSEARKKRLLSSLGRKYSRNKRLILLP
ncbi:hypothetical protein A2W24_06210 [Microgenomates group bacterium RBG_16_45_19]|nr:MAG: hypothetical protein A2W24_06210 [Microgenomates group bacterium RBG_16_45_19]